MVEDKFIFMNFILQNKKQANKNTHLHTKNIQTLTNKYKIHITS